MLVTAFAMFAAVTFPPQAQGRAAVATPSRAPHASRVNAATAVPGGMGRLAAGDLYSARAKRRIASFLRMRLLELRLRGLSRAIDVVEHRLSLDELLRTP